MLTMEIDSKIFGPKDQKDSTKNCLIIWLEKLNRKSLFLLKSSKIWLNWKSKMLLQNFLRLLLKTISSTKRTSKTFKAPKTSELKLLIIPTRLSYPSIETSKAVINRMGNRKKCQWIHLIKKFLLFFLENAQSKTFQMKTFFWHSKWLSKVRKTHLFQKAQFPLIFDQTQVTPYLYAGRMLIRTLGS